MELASALVWGISSIAVAGFLDWRGMDWMQDQVGNRVLDQVRQEPLVFEPGERLDIATLK